MDAWKKNENCQPFDRVHCPYPSDLQKEPRWPEKSSFSPMSIAPNLGIEPHEPIINTSFSRNPWFLLWNQILFMNHHQIIKPHKHGFFNETTYIPMVFPGFSIFPIFPMFPPSLLVAHHPPFLPPAPRRRPWRHNMRQRRRRGARRDFAKSPPSWPGSEEMGLQRWKKWLVLPWLFYHGELKAPEVGMDMGPLYLYNYSFIKKQHVAMINPMEPGTLK